MSPYTLRKIFNTEGTHS